MLSITLAVLALAPGDDLARIAPRATAAEFLRDGLLALEDHEEGCEHRFPLLVEAGRNAAGALGDSHLGEELETLVYELRWLAVTRPGPAETRLERDLQRTLADLEFSPLIEAPLPEGFPAPTPVREIERKTYPAYRLARADMKGTQNGAFWQLFQHIKKHDIPMTAPVEMTMGEDGDELDMAFMYEHTRQGETGPDGTVEVMDIAPMEVVSIGCRGNSTGRAVEAARESLLAWIAAHPEVEVAGPARQFGYNSPMVSSSRRYFEVQIPVRERGEPRRDDLVIDFAADNEHRRWASVDDVVMGGRSDSRLARDGERCVFRGVLSLENNGGFASVRCAPSDLDLAGARGLALRYRGDGKTYKLRLRMDGKLDGVSYEARFDTLPGEWMETAFDLAEFRPVWRGNAVPNAPALDPARVRSVTLMISDKQAGEFELELDWLARS
jgi:NADH dehydrogenase [ubiquinone] 1 alpha subcomplex assembly factor 1